MLSAPLGRHTPASTRREDHEHDRAVRRTDPHTYTAAEACADGHLVDALALENQEAAEIFRRLGGGAPVWMTTELRDAIQKAVDHPRHCNDWAGVCHDIVWMSRFALGVAKTKAREVGIGECAYRVIITGVNRRKYQVITLTLSGDGLTFGIRS